MHAAAIEGIVTTCEEFAVIIILCAYAHVSVNGLRNVLNVLEGSDGRSRGVAYWQYHVRYATEDCVLRDGCEVGSAASVFRCGAVVADGVAKAANTHHAISKFNCLCTPVVRNGEGDSLSSGSGCHRVLVALAFSYANAFGRLLVIKERIEVVDACQLASGMIKT